ncbi:MAG TPA: hypothetical protein VLF90_00090 [Patescibacteria group bacterium]|nr:hypothetical protein [Patescibacteria group bacterium]
MKDIYQKLAAFAGSRKFYYLVVALFVLEGSWIALSSHYPMAFDEAYHFGLIRLYAQHLSPWWHGQPTGADMFGAVYRDPSYLYHWLMSFPYHLISHIFHETIGQVIALRLINVAIFASGLVLLRQLLLKATKSKALVNIVLLFLVLTPVIPSLAGQINYDNLLFVVVPGALLLAVLFTERLRKKQLDLKLLTSLAILCLLASLVKYAFLPIFLVIVVFVLLNLYQAYHKTGRRLGHELAVAYKGLSTLTKFGLLAGLIISSVLFLERYGLNAVRYHTPLPECNQVLSVERCLSYSPWQRNHNILLSKGLPGSGTIHFSSVTFTQHWFFVLYRTMFYVLNGPDSGYSVGEPLLLPAVVAVLVLVVGLICLLRYGRRIFQANSARILLAAVIVVYAGMLWLQNYTDYLHLGQPVALQGRYLIPILAPTYLLLGIGIVWALRRHRQTQVILAIIVIALFLQGGGIITFLIRSDDTWYIQGSPSAHINNAIRPVAQHLVVGK